MTLAAVAAAPAAGRLATSFGLRATAASGLVLVVAGLLLMACMSEDGGLPLVLLGMVVGEVGFTLSIVPLEIAASGGAGENERGLAAGLLNTSMQLGSALGLAVVATVVAASSGGGAADPGSLVVGLRWGLLACVGFAGLALPIVLWGLPKGEPPDERAPT
jgi:MFS family permease